MGRTLYDKLWDSHVVRAEEDGTALLYIDRHLVHEVTSPQAFEGLRLAGRKPWRISSIVATADHNTPTTDWASGLAGRRVFLAIGNQDARVGTASCVRLGLRLLEEARAAGPGAAFPRLLVVDAPGHRLPDEWIRAGAAYLLEQCGVVTPPNG